MFTIAVCDDDMQERMQEVQIVKNIFSQKELEAGIEEFQTGQHFLDVLHRVPYDIVHLHRSTKPSFVCPHTERSIKGPRKNFGFRISG